MYVPVVDHNQKPLMPTTPSRARRWIKVGKATPFWKRGIFCVRLNVDPSDNKTQDIVVGVDPGSKREGVTIKSERKTYFNFQLVAIDWVKERLRVRSYLRKTRRSRHTPYRQPRFNNRQKKDFIPPSTKSRWGLKLRFINYLSKLFPISHIVVEDVHANMKKGKRLWNVNFSAVQCGKNWFYNKCRELYTLKTYTGRETKKFRNILDLSKLKNKTSTDFHAHCVDSWVLANSVWNIQTTVDDKQIVLIKPFRFYRRQLHVQNPIKGGVRKKFGSTRSEAFKRGSLVKHIKHGIVYVGGCSKNRISLYDLKTGMILSRVAKVEDCKFLTYLSWR